MMERIASARPLPAVFVLILLLWAGSAAAVDAGAGAIILQIDPSARASGMGLASTAVWWGQAPDHWANPALLGYHQGFRYEYTRHPLAQGLANDIFYRAEQFTYGAYGVGILVTGSQGYFLDMGWQQATDESGQTIGEFHSTMEARAWGVGVSLAGLVDALRDEPPGGGGSLARRFDLAVGLVEKEFQDFLAPDWATQDGTGGGSGKVKDRDRGILLRVSPINTVGQPDAGPGAGRLLWGLFGGVRTDLSAGWSILNGRDRMIHHVDASQDDPMPKVHRRGLAVRVASGVPGLVLDRTRGTRFGWLVESFDPLLSWGYSWDQMTAGIRWNQATESWEFEKDDSDQEDYRGWELSLANIFHVRRGWVSYERGDIDGPTEGWGVGLVLGGVAGWRYDEAKIPQAAGFPRSWRRTWTVFLDGTALWRALHAT